MDKSPSLASSEESGSGARGVAMETIAAAVRLVARIPKLRRNARAWALFRVVLGLAGAALVVLPIGLANNYYYAVFGMILFVAAILLPPAQMPVSVEEKARELGALAVLDGGRLIHGGSGSAAVNLYVNAERILALDARFRTLLVVPVNELSFVHTEQTDERWILSVLWTDSSAQFAYSGMSAEHLAHTAETALQSFMAQDLRNTQKSRAASA